MPKFEIRLRYRLRAGELAGNVECNEIFSDNDVRNTITVISNLYIKSFESKLIKYQVYYLLTCRNVTSCAVGGVIETHRPKAASSSHVFGKLLNVDEIELLLRGLTGGEAPGL